jgi:hypothetical protein
MCLRVSQKKINMKNNLFCILKVTEDGIRSGVGSGTGSGSINQRYRSVDPDPHQHVTDPQHCLGYHS